MATSAIAPKPSTELSQDRQAYLQRIQGKIYQILTPVLDPHHIQSILGAQALNEYWVKVFTHKSVDPVNNYEVLEFYGDKAMNFAFSEYVRKIAEKQDYNLDQAKATLVLNYYMSKEYQARLGRNLGLVEYVQFDPEFPKVTIHVQEDVTEAFFGALNNSVNDLIQPGLGYIYVYNLIQHIFKDVNINFDEIQKDPVTQLKELYEKMGWGNEPRYELSQSDDPSRGEVKVKVISRQGDVLGIGYGSQGRREREAAEQALQTLETQGITLEYAEEERTDRNRRRNQEFDLQYRRTEAAIQALNNQAQQAGKVQISNFKISQVESRKVQGGIRYTFAIEVAYPRKDGTLVWKKIFSVVGSDKDQTKVELMKQFADQNRIPPNI